MSERRGAWLTLRFLQRRERLKKDTTTHGFPARWFKSSTTSEAEQGKSLSRRLGGDRDGKGKGGPGNENGEAPCGPGGTRGEYQGDSVHGLLQSVPNRMCNDYTLPRVGHSGLPPSGGAKGCGGGRSPRNRRGLTCRLWPMPSSTTRGMPSSWSTEATASSFDTISAVGGPAASAGEARGRASSGGRSGWNPTAGTRCWHTT